MDLAMDGPVSGCGTRCVATKVSTWPSFETGHIPAVLSNVVQVAKVPGQSRGSLFSLYDYFRAHNLGV